MLITVAWFDDFALFEQDCPVHCLAASVRASYSQEQMVLLINNAKQLPQEYRLLLRHLDVEIVDITCSLTDYLDRYYCLAHLNHYECSCLVRWLIIQDFLAERCCQEPVLIVDGDVLFLVPPETIKKAFNGLTFVLQGCPALTHLATAEAWLAQYRLCLDAFAADPIGFSHVLAKNIDEKLARCTDCGAWRTPIASDQDLLNALMVNGLLQQVPISDAAKRHRLALCENAMFMPGQILSDNVIDQPVRFKSICNQESLSITANGASLTHLHFQSDCVQHFTGVLSYLEQVQRYSDRFFLPLRRVTNTLGNHPGEDAYFYTGPRLSRVALYQRVRELARCIHNGFCSSQVPQELIDRFFPLNPSPFSLADIYNPDTWWQTDLSFAWEDSNENL